MEREGSKTMTNNTTAVRLSPNSKLKLEEMAWGHHRRFSEHLNVLIDEAYAKWKEEKRG